MANQYVNKVIIGTEVKMDLTGDDVTPEKLTKGIKAHDKSGAPIVGTNTFDSDTSGDTATAAELLLGKTAHVTPVSIPMGFHDGSGKGQIAETEAAKIIAENIRDGITILGVKGSMSGTEGAKPQAKTVTPTFEAQEITPDSPTYNYLSSVTVGAIPVSYTDNDQGGQTLKVGA